MLFLPPTHPLHLCVSQKSRQSHTGPATSAGHHLHALLRESGGGRHLANRLHLFQLLPAVFPGENRDNDAARHGPTSKIKNPPHTHTGGESRCSLMQASAVMQLL